MITSIPDIWLDPPVPREGETHEQYLRRLDLLGRGYAHQEIVQHGQYNKLEPPRKLWRNGVTALGLGIMLRERAVDMLGCSGVLIHAGHRMRGGAKQSQHRWNRAYDFGLLQKDHNKSLHWTRLLVQLWCEFGERTKMGLGLYMPRGQNGCTVCHVDAGFRCRTYQAHGREQDGTPKYVSPPAAFAIAEMIGLKPPVKAP